MNKKENIKMIKSIIKRVNKMTKLTKQLEETIDNASIIKHYDKLTNKWIFHKKIKTNAK